MAITLADTYYLKALDSYPWDLEQATEALNYAIGYDNEHAGALCLLGKLNMYELCNYEEAENHYEKALVSDINYTETYYSYTDLLINIGEYERAKKLIKHAYKIKGINLARMKHYEGLIAEINGDLEKALKYMTCAYDNSYKSNEHKYLKSELDRIKSKQKGKDKTSKRKIKKKSKKVKGGK